MLVVDEGTALAPESKRSASHYDPMRAGFSPEAMSAYLSGIQRTINCLSDPDRNTRKQAIASLLAKLLPAATAAAAPGGSISVAAVSAPDPGMLQALICGPLLHPVVAMLHDPGEGARLAAAELLQGAAAAVPDFSAALPVLVPELMRRMGHLPVVEPAEEVRLLLSGLVSAIVQG
jgi:dynein assembly factor 5